MTTQGESDPYAAAIADLEARRNEIDAAIATLKRMRALPAGGPLVAAPPNSALTQPPSTSVTPSPDQNTISKSRYFGMTLPDAAVAYLDLCGGPRTAREIWLALSADGVTSAASDPVHAVQWALTRREKRKSDVVLLDHKKWDIRKRHTKHELDLTSCNASGTAARDRRSHSEKTKEGIANLRSRGVRVGRQNKFTGEDVLKVHEAIMSGMPKTKAAALVGMHPTNYGYITKRYDITKWRPGDPWPPPPRKPGSENSATDEQPPDDESRQLRLVKG